MSRWSLSEDAALAAVWFDAKPNEVLAAVAPRKWDACKRRAQRLGLRRLNRGGAAHARQWTPEQDAELLALRKAGLTFEAAGKALGISKDSALGRVHRIQRNAAKSPAPKPIETTSWGRELDRSSGFPMPMLRI